MLVQSSEAMLQGTTNTNPTVTLFGEQAPIVERLLIDPIEQLETEIELRQNAEFSEPRNANFRARRRRDRKAGAFELELQGRIRRRRLRRRRGRGGPAPARLLERSRGRGADDQRTKYRRQSYAAQHDIPNMRFH
jgi:hypothetical protein